MVKTNIIIDGNYLVMKNVFILKKLRSLHDLQLLLEKDYDNITKSFPFDNVYFVSDSRESNWRKQQYKEYKGKRKKDSDIDWDFVFKTYDEFKENIKNRRNSKLLEFPGLEGDDFIAHIIQTSNKKGFSNILVASDGDLQQLLKYDLNKNYINIQWNYRFSDERLYLPKNYQLFLNQLNSSESADIFSLDNDSEFCNYIENLIQRTKIKSVLSEQIIFEKIVQGDTSDNIISIIKVKDGKLNPEGRGIGEKGANSVYKLYKEINPEPIDIDSEDFVNKLIDVVLYYKKIKNADSDFKNKIRDNIIFNRKMIKLDSSYMPDNISENMKNHFNKIDNTIIDYKIENIERKLEEENFFNEEESDIDENFRVENDNIDFDPDSYWEL